MKRILFALVAALAFAACQQSTSLGGISGSSADARIPNSPLPEPTDDPVPTPKPDVVVTALTVDDYTSTRISYSYTIKNIGSASIQLSSVAMVGYISNDATLDSSDPTTGFNNAGPAGQYLLPGASLSKSFSTTPGPGLIQPEKYFFIKAQTSVSELSKANNTRYTQIYLKWVDFKFSSATATIQSNGYVTTTAVIKNNGLEDISLSGVTLSYLLSSDTVVSSNDLPNGGVSVAAWTGLTKLTPGQEITISFSPSLNASYNSSTHRYLLFFIDSNRSIFEVDETNNVAADGI